MEIQLKIDSKGRLHLPPEIREKIGNTILLRETSEGYLIMPASGQPTSFLEEFRKLISSEPKRTGKPENWPPSKMKRNPQPSSEEA